MKRPSPLFLCFIVTLTLAICGTVVTCSTGCTSAQVAGTIDGANKVIAVTKDPVVQFSESLPSIGPYIKLGAEIISEVCYEAVRVLNVFAPHAGEPVAPTTAPSQ